MINIINIKIEIDIIKIKNNIKQKLQYYGNN